MKARLWLFAGVTALLLTPFLEAQEDPKKHPDTKVFAKAKGLSKGAKTEDWTSFLGKKQNGVSNETMLDKTWKTKGPTLLWRFKKGSSYTSPAILGKRLFYFDRVKDEERVLCLHAEDGRVYWEHKYPTKYKDRYGFGNGPRASPIVDGKCVYTVGVEGKLHCFDIASGKVLWKRDLRDKDSASTGFFGITSTPLIEGQGLILNIGARGGPNVLCLDKATGKKLWGTGKKWGASYASPVSATIHGKRRVLVFAGGESRPPHGGLLCIDPKDGKLDFRFSWRARAYESVNACNPVVVGNRVFLTECYGRGGAMVDISKDFKATLGWKSVRFGSHFSTPLLIDGHLYGFDGRGSMGAQMVCYEAKTGRELWRESVTWKEELLYGGKKKTIEANLQRGNLLAADGAVLGLGEQGHLCWLKLSPKGFKILARSRLFFARETWSTPVLSHGLLYVMQHTKDGSSGEPPQLRCYDLRAPEKKG